jgi:hypothetical protein
MRWTQADPLDQAGDRREGNRYSYGAGDPVNRADSTGLATRTGSGAASWCTEEGLSASKQSRAAGRTAYRLCVEGDEHAPYDGGDDRNAQADRACVYLFWIARPVGAACLAKAIHDME